MEKSNAFFEIPKCPACGKAHKYSLAVIRSSYMFGVSETDTPTEKRMRRLFTCPKTGTEFEGLVVLQDDPKNKIVSIAVEGLLDEEPSPMKADTTVEVQQIGVISPHSKALYEAGKAILLDSITTGREFCKSMIGTSTGAIPLYLGLLTFLLPEKFVLGSAGGVTIATPAIGFLLAAILFTLGYLPISGRFSLDLIEEIEQALEKNLAYRKRFIWSGLTVFVLSTLLAIWAILLNLGVK
jgi:hypothetical protein